MCHYYLCLFQSYLASPGPAKYPRSHLCLYETVRGKILERAAAHAPPQPCGHSLFLKTRSDHFAGRQPRRSTWQEEEWLKITEQMTFTSLFTSIVFVLHWGGKAIQIFSFCFLVTFDGFDQVNFTLRWREPSPNGELYNHLVFTKKHPVIPKSFEKLCYGPKTTKMQIF